MEKNFEQAMNELEEIVKKLQTGELNLDDSMKMFKEGMELANLCNSQLEKAEKDISILVKNESGNIIEEKFEV